MLIQKALSKIRLRTGDDVFLMVVYESNKKLSVKILNLESKEVYVGQSNDIELRNQAARIRLTFDEYSQKMIDALIEGASDSINFLYSLDELHGRYTFQWKSIDEEQTIISLGSVLVEKENFVTSMTDMLELISCEMHFMRSKIHELNTEVDKTKNQTSEAVKQLWIATEMKEKLEKEMYSKFVLILNEKKRKIVEMKQKNKHNSHSNSELQRKKSKISSKSLISDSSDNTDIEEPGPSTSKKDESLIFLDDNKPILPKNQNRIRNRKAIFPKKENGNKSTLMNYNQSSKNITVDDNESDEFLLDNL